MSEVEKLQARVKELEAERDEAQHRYTIARQSSKLFAEQCDKLKAERDEARAKINATACLGHLVEVFGDARAVVTCSSCEWSLAYTTLEHGEAGFLKHQNEVHGLDVYFRRRPDGSRAIYKRDE